MVKAVKVVVSVSGSDIEAGGENGKREILILEVPYGIIAQVGIDKFVEFVVKDSNV